MENLSCSECGADSGPSLVCNNCLPHLSQYRREKIKRSWHRIIVQRANCACEECGHSAPFDSGELCGDHIQTQGSRPDLVFDVTNGRCVCLGCHNKRHSKGLPKKAAARPVVKKLPICAVQGCPILAIGDGWTKPKNCWKHQ
jgi:hypothetical protein